MTWLDFVVRGTVILVAAFAAAYSARRASAAVRHFVWTLAFIAMLLLPAAMRVGPRFAIPAPTSPPVIRTTASSASVTYGRPSPPPAPVRGKTPAALYLYAIGLLLVLGRFTAGAWRMSRMLRTADPSRHAATAAEHIRVEFGIARTIRVVESASASVPMTWGIGRPVVILPSAARDWPEPRLRAVLLHEMVHIARFDLLAQLAAQAACCLYWFHPLVWTAARQLRKERERACDDAVLRRGVTAPDYAGHLMELARVLVERQASLADAPAMAEAGDLEDRVRALLDRTRNRAPLTRRVATAVVMLACVLMLPVVSLTSYAQEPRGTLAGVVTDPSGARVPGSAVSIKNLDGRNEEQIGVNEVGEYGFAAIPPGHYTIEVRAAGFKIGKRDIEVVAGAASRADVALEIGGISETVKIRAARPTPAPPAARAMGTPQRIPIGGNVQVSKLVSKVDPEYPADLKQQGIAGSVVIRAIISKTGDILGATVINTVNPGLAKAALDAVKQWRYQPTLLNGQPVEVLTTVTLSFELEQ